MSLAINSNQVSHVLLADGWHKCEEIKPGAGVSSFDLDSFEFLEDGRLIFGGGQSGVCSTGASWFEMEDGIGMVVCCPLTSVLAVRRYQ